MTSPIETYRIREGTKDEGKDYEFLMTSLLALRCIQHPNVENVRIATDAIGVGDFDDVILMITKDNGDRFDFLLQLKHKGKPNALTPRELQGGDGKLPFKKYCEHIVTLKKEIGQTDTIAKQLGSFHNVYFVLFTNRGMDLNKFQGNKLLFYEVDECDGETNFLKSLLNTYRSNDHCVFKFDLPNIPKEISSESADIFANFRLFTDQISKKNLHQEIASEIRKILATCNLLKTDENEIADQYNKYIKSWANGELGGYYCLTKEEVLFKLIELCLNQYEVNLRVRPFKGYDSNKKNIWNRLVSGKSMTIIDSDEIACNYIVQFISNEVEKYCTGFDKKWSDKLSEPDQQLFYKKYEHLKQPMLNIVGNNEKIGLRDVYKCLWRIKELPLLLKVENLEEYHSILKILSLSNFSYNVIILNETSTQLSKQENIQTFQTLWDLNQDERDMVLSQPARLQGRNLSKLGGLVDNTMFEYIKSRDIISILSDTFCIGEELKNLPRYFIKRNITKIFLSSKAFQSYYLDNEKIFWSHPTKDRLDNLLQDSNLVFTDPEEINKYKLSKNNIHCCCSIDDDLLEWRWTFGSTRSIRDFKDNSKVVYETDISYYFSNYTNIISEVPGMGKSILMDYAAHKAPTTKWVLRVDLSNHRHLRYYRTDNNCKNPNTEARKHLEYFFEQLEKNVLSKTVFLKLLKTKNIVVLLDGFDEISISYKDEVTNIAMSLQKEGYHVWLTTRPHMQEHLEKEFNTFAISLQPFTEDNKKAFLVDYYSATIQTSGCEERLNNFVEGLLSATKKNLHDYDAKFTGIPLQTELLADFFVSKCKECLAHSRPITFDEKFDLLNLYESFIKKKLDKLDEKYEQSALEETDTCRKDQPLLAMQLVFRLEDFEEMDIIKEVNDSYHRNLRKKQHLQRDGVITMDKDHNLSCTHRTFAEFLAAKWLSENLETQDEHLLEFVYDLVKQRFSKNYQFLFNIFDRILALDCDLHMAIINDQLDEATNINLESLNKCDRGGRTVLHMLALYDDEDALSNNENSKMLKILKKLPKPQLSKLCSLREKLGFTPLDYALANDSSLILANALCANPHLAPINAYITPEYFRLYMTKCVDSKLKQLFGLLLAYFVTRDLLQGATTPNMNLKLYLSKQKTFEQRSEYLKGLVGMTLLEYLQSKGVAYSGYSNNSYKDLRFAVCFGTVQNVQDVAPSKMKVSQKDVDNNTPLHYAVLGQMLEKVKTLLLNGANVNKRNLNLQTPLHLGFATKNVDLINLLLSKDPNFDTVDKKGQNSLHYAVTCSDLAVVEQLIDKLNINKQNNEGNTPLHLALMARKWDVADLLLNKRADINILNNKNQNALHYVIFYDGNHMIYNGLFNKIDKNVQDMDGNTPLHFELQKSVANAETVQFLIETGADVNVQNHRKDAPLHIILRNKISPNSTIVKLLFDHGADINLQNNSGDNALHCAIDCEDTSAVRMMLPKLKNANDQTGNGNTYLHLAAMNGLSDIIQLLISHGVNFNRLNVNKETPLHLATRSGFTKVISILLDNRVAVNKIDNNGYTPLHIAVEDDNLDAAKLLVTKGADVNIKSRKHKSPLDLARGNEMIALLSTYAKTRPIYSSPNKKKSNVPKKGR